MDTLSGQFIVACWTILLIFMVISAFYTKRTVERNWTWRIFSLVAFVIFVLLRRSSGVSLNLGVGSWSHTLIGDIIADCVTLAGCLVVLWARATIGRNWSAFVVIKEDHELIERGPYRYVRHPMYSGLLLMILGGAIYLGNLAGFALVVICLMAFAFKAHLEERLLTRHFPQTYPQYKARVKALIPFVL